MKRYEAKVGRCKNAIANKQQANNHESYLLSSSSSALSYPDLIFSLGPPQAPCYAVISGALGGNLGVMYTIYIST
jgi:hypothetical protein